MTTSTGPRPPRTADGAPHGPRLRGGAAGFLVVAFGISWLAWGTAIVAGWTVSDPVGQVLFMLGGTGPTLAALVLRLGGRRSPRLASARRMGAWIPAALGLGLLPAVVAAFLPSVLGASGVGADEVAAAVAAAGGSLLFVVTALVTGPLSEEIGWRGYAQPRLRRRFSPLATSLVLGICWGAWHLPLFFLPGTWQESVGLASAEGLLILGGAVPLSALAWFVSERLRGGVPAAVLLHAASNASLSLFPPSSSLAGLLFVGTLLVLAGVVLSPGGRRSSGARLAA